MAEFFTVGIMILIVSAAALAWLAKKLGQPSLVMYILGGMALGPAGASVASFVLQIPVAPAVTSTEYISLMSELGLAFLLFFIGLEIEIDDIKDVLGQTLGVSVAQMSVIAVIFYFISSAAGFGQTESVIIALAFMYSSTAVVVKILSDRNEVETKAGQLDVSMLLFEDVTVVLVMAVLSSLAAASTFSLVSIGTKGAVIFGFVGLIAAASVASSKYLLPKAMEYISKTSHVFLIHGLAWMFLFVFLSENYLGLSVEVGAFFAGVSIAQLPYSHELRARVKPVTDLFLAVFFLSLGLGLSTSSLVQSLGLAALFSAGIFVFKFAIYYSATYFLGFTAYDSFKSSINMTQTSTFSIVYASVALESGLIGEQAVGLITLVALITMAGSSYLITFSDNIYSRLFGNIPSSGEEGKKTGLVVYPERGPEGVVDVLAQTHDDIKVLTESPEKTRSYGSEMVDALFGSFRHEQTREEVRLQEASTVLDCSGELDVSREVADTAPDQAQVLFLSEQPPSGVQRGVSVTNKSQIRDQLEEAKE